MSGVIIDAGARILITASVLLIKMNKTDTSYIKLTQKATN
jgi:hypothetical protein